MTSHYYNEIEPFAVEWLRNLMAAGLIPGGDIDTRSIEDVRPNDLAGYVQCHFFAGAGGWLLALALAGWPVDRPVWTGSCPCQPFSVAGKGNGAADKRHLWPAWFHLIAQCRPSVVFGEQVAAAVGHAWLDGVCADLEGQGYAIGAAVLPACAAGAPHRRDRLWFGAEFVADSDPQRGAARIPGSQPWQEGLAGIAHDRSRQGGTVADTDRIGGQVDSHAGRGAQGSGAREIARLERASDGALAHTRQGRRPNDELCAGRSVAGERGTGSAWAEHDWIVGHDGKARRVPVAESGIRLLAHGIPGRVGRLRAYGNAIVPQVAAEFVQAFAEARGLTFPAMEAAA